MNYYIKVNKKQADTLIDILYQNGYLWNSEFSSGKINENKKWKYKQYVLNKDEFVYLNIYKDDKVITCSTDNHDDNIEITYNQFIRELKLKRILEDEC